MLIVRILWVKYPWEQHPVKHLILEIFLILLFTNGFVLLIHHIEVSTGMLEPTEKLAGDIFITNLITLLIVSIHEAVVFYQQWKYNFSKSVRLEKDNIEAKYETLKTQINPHFLFNSLNSLTTLVDNNPDAVDYIQNLSEFLRYMLKSRNNELVLVTEEINIAHKYLTLQKTRFKNNLRTKIEIPAEMMGHSLPPLVLQMLIENCIKHNIVSKEMPLTIQIYIWKDYLVVENNLQKKKAEQSTGQGLKNIIDRYRFFTSQHVLVIETTTNFQVKIPLLKVNV